MFDGRIEDASGFDEIEKRLQRGTDRQHIARRPDARQAAGTRTSVGSHTVNVLPTPSVLFTATSPPD